MIIFELACGQGHRFEGWFASADDFARQSDDEMVHCPVCDDGGVIRVPSAKVRAGSVSSASAKSSDAVSPVAPAQPVIAGLPTELVAKLREIVRNTENVGARFPEEARKIHYDEAPARSIRGQASKDEAQELSDEGIDFSQLPPFLTGDTH